MSALMRGFSSRRHEHQNGRKAAESTDTVNWGTIPWMIQAAVNLSAVAQHWPDFYIILLRLLANAMVGFWEENQAGNAIATLKTRLAIEARVRCDGKSILPAVREIVRGDVIRMRLSQIVPVDAPLLEGRPGGSRSVGAHGRIVARWAKTR
jgi:magnesium-transporting ATPase (P-type)